MITLTKEEAQQVLEWVEAQQVPRMIGAQKIIETLRARLVHTDHPVRHWDRTCPACTAQPEPDIVQDAIVYGTGITKDGKRIDPASIYKEPEPEPVAWIYKHKYDGGEYTFNSDFERNVCNKDEFFTTPLYTAPPQREWQGLTRKQLLQIWGKPENFNDPMRFARAIEAKLKEKNP